MEIDRKRFRWGYRIGQFWHMLFAMRPTASERDMICHILNPQQMDLFNQLSYPEQAHALRVLHRVQNTHPLQIDPSMGADLQVAALLHDIGKSRYPLHLWERVLIVLCQALFPQQIQKWGKMQTKHRWVRSLSVAVCHPQWGAEMVAQTGASPLVVKLIEHHQDTDLASRRTQFEQLLYILKAADNAS